MSPLDSTPSKISLEYEIASTYLEVVPKAMAKVRQGLRASRKAELSLPQYRTLIKLREQTCTNNELADHIGLSVAAMSRLIQGLVKKGFLEKRSGLEDRREVRVQLSRKGRNTINHMRETFRQELSMLVTKQLNHEDKKKLQEGFFILRKLLSL